jgi:flagellar FliL protein
MAQAKSQDDTEAQPPRRSRLPLVLALALAPVAAGGAFYAVWSGLLGASFPPAAAARAPDALPPMAFVPLDPIIVTLSAGTRTRHLRFAAQIEVEPARTAEVQSILPRLLDVLNVYLRALDPAELDDPAALLRLRGQMLRRLRMVAGEGRVRDLLVTEFVVN